MFKKIFSVIAAMLLVVSCQGNNSSVDSGSWADGQKADQYLAQGVESTVYFAFDSSALSEETKGILNKQANWWQASDKPTLVVEGHCDQRGTREYNLALGERRANAVKNYLVSTGVPAAKVDVISYGKERPAVEGENEEAWAKNRRSVTVKSH